MCCIFERRSNACGPPLLFVQYKQFQSQLAWSNRCFGSRLMESLAFCRSLSPLIFVARGAIALPVRHNVEMRAVLSALSSKGYRTCSETPAVRYRGVLSPLRSRRAVIHLYGKDSYSFLNGLVSQRIAGQENNQKVGPVAVYAPFLSSKGRVLADAILYHRPRSRSFFIEADSSVLPSLTQHLLKYKLRAQIHIEEYAQQAYSVWSLLATDQESLRSLIVRIANTTEAAQLFVHADPRWPLALRIIAPSDEIPLRELLYDGKRVNNKQQEGLLYYDDDCAMYPFLRQLNGIAEGSSEMPDSAIPLEVNMDRTNGIDFQKGCYLGQELVARTHHQGLVRKRLLPFVVTSLAAKDMADVGSHPIHQHTIEASQNVLVSDSLMYAVENGWVEPEARPSLTVGSTISPALPSQQPVLGSARVPSSVVHVASLMNSGLGMIRLEQLINQTEPVADGSFPPAFNTSFISENKLVKVVLPIWWKPLPLHTMETEDVSSHLRTVQWDLSPNVTRPF